MVRYSLEDRLLIVKTHYKNGENFTVTIRKIRDHFGVHKRPSRPTIENLIKKFERTFSLKDERDLIRHRPKRSVENIAAVRDSVAARPSTSIRHRCQELNIHRSTLQRILKKDLHLHAYKIQLTQQLQPNDHRQRRNFTNWIFEQLQTDDEFHNKIIFSDEAHFHLNGFVNKQNSRIWGDENPYVIQKLPLHPQKVIVWCAMWAGGIIGPYFFENDEGAAVTVDGNRYRAMLTDFFWQELDGIDINKMWFQQDGATCHTARETMTLLETKFSGRVISRFGDQNWPPRSCDLTCLDYFLWGFLKSKVYVNHPETTEELKGEITRQIRQIQQPLLQNVLQNFVKRLHTCQQSNGGHLTDILFHV